MPTFRNVSRDKIKRTYLQTHGTPFENNYDLKPYLSAKESFPEASVWRASNEGMRYFPFDPIETGACSYLPGNYIISFTQTVVFAHIKKFKQAITMSDFFI